MNADHAIAFGELLRKRRLAGRLTQEALAERAGVSARAITDLERGVIRAPRRDTLQLIAGALELSQEEVGEWETLRRQLSTRKSGSGETRARENALPRPPNPIIGRDREMTSLINLLVQPDVRLVTVTGTGGVGKTRFALEVGHEMAHMFPDGVRFIELVSVREPELMLPYLAQELGLRETREDRVRERLQHYLSQREMLLILDNVEQLQPAAADLAKLLADTSNLKLLLTSRAGMNVRAEHQFPLSPLSLPEWDNQPSGERLEQYPAIALFLERGRQVSPEFTLTEDNARAITAVCGHLDGLPLAIELAAARIRVISPEQMLAKLTDRLAFLTGGRQDSPDRHRTMRAAIGWSYDLLDPDEQRLFRRLAVFNDGWTMDAADAVSPDDVNVLEGVQALANTNMIRRTPDAGGQARFTMLEVVREFGLEQLERHGELETARELHGHFFLQLAETAEPALRGPEQVRWLALMGEELGNYRAALEWSAGPNLDPSIGLRLTGVLSWFWESRGHVSEGRAWLSRALEREPQDPRDRMRALYGAGWLAHIQHDSEAAGRLLNDSLRLARELDDNWTVAWTLHLLGRVAYFDGDAQTARDFGNRSLETARAIGDKWVEAWALHLLALAAHIENDAGTARDLYSRSLEIRREIRYPEGIGTVTGLLGMLALNEGDDEQALRLLRESLITNRELGARWLVINMLANLVKIAAVSGDAERAVRLAGFVDEMSDSVGASPIPIASNAFQEGLTAATGQLTEDEHRQAWTEGRSMSMDEAIEDGLLLGQRDQ